MKSQVWGPRPTMSTPVLRTPIGANGPGAAVSSTALTLLLTLQQARTLELALEQDKKKGSPT